MAQMHPAWQSSGRGMWLHCVSEAEDIDRTYKYLTYDKSVPLDYWDPTIGTARVALARYRATKFPRKGMVMFNPGRPPAKEISARILIFVFVSTVGGPGVPGTPQAYNLGDLYQRTFTGEDYDILGFDIRGIGETE